MKLRATVGGLESDVDVRQAAERVLASVDGRDYELNVRRTDDRAYLILSGGRVFECRVEGPFKPQQAVDVTIAAHRYSITIADPKRLRALSNSAAGADGAARIIAPMPGKIVRVLVTTGDRVEAGAGIVVVEAMKMQNEMKSPKAGIVAAVNVAVGATVNGGDVLAMIE